MAFDFKNVGQQAIGSGMTGTSISPGWGTLIGAAGGLIGGLFREGARAEKERTGQTNFGLEAMGAISDPYGYFFGPQPGGTNKPPRPEMLNQAAFDAWTQRMEGDLLNSENARKQWLAQGQGYMGQTSNLLDQIANFKSGVQYDPMAAQRQFQALAPGFQSIARQSVGTGALDTDLAQLRQQAMGQVAAELGPGFTESGAGLAALSAGLAQPQYQATQQRQALEAQLAGQLMGQGMQDLSQSYLNQAQIGLQQEQMGLGALGTAASGYSGLTSAALQGAGLEQDRWRTIYGGLNEAYAPQWYTEPMILSNPGAGGNDITSLLQLFIQSGGADMFKKYAGGGGGAPAAGGGLSSTPPMIRR